MRIARCSGASFTEDSLHRQNVKGPIRGLSFFSLNVVAFGGANQHQDFVNHIAYESRFNGPGARSGNQLLSISNTIGSNSSEVVIARIALSMYSVPP